MLRATPTLTIPNAVQLPHPPRELIHDSNSPIDSRLLTRAHGWNLWRIIPTPSILQTIATLHLLATGTQVIRKGFARAVRHPAAGRVAAVGEAWVLGATAHAGWVPRAGPVDGGTAVFVAGSVLDADARGVVGAVARVANGGQGRGREEEGGEAHDG